MVYFVDKQVVCLQQAIKDDDIEDENHEPNGMSYIENRLPMQGTWVQALVWEDPICHGAIKPVCQVMDGQRLDINIPE